VVTVMVGRTKLRFGIFILILVILLQLFASRYVSLNDLAVYGAPLQDGDIYRGDYAFEFAQLMLSKILGIELVIYGLQFFLLVLVVAYIYSIRMEVSGNIYMVSVLIFSSPVVMVGLLNSIRQSIALLIAMLAFEFRNVLCRFGLLSFAIMTHSVSFVLIPLLFFTIIVKNFRSFSMKRKPFYWIIGVLFLALLASPWYLKEFINLLDSVYDRYSVYIFDAVVFTEGRFGGEKLVVWTSFWTTTLVVPIIINPMRRAQAYLVVPLIFTLLVGIDSILRGFDEFHSRLLMLNNVIVLVWLVDSVKNDTNKLFSYFMVFVFTVFNPSTLGVLK